MNQSIFEIQADFCKAMGNAARLQIIYVLREHPLSVGEIAQLTDFGPSFVSRQLSILRNVGAVKFQRRGHEIIYQLTDQRICEVCDMVKRVLSGQMHRQFESIE